MPERFRSTPEQRQHLRDEVFRRLEEGVASIQDSESFARYLALQAKFHHYSAHNVALILAQLPDATIVASFRRWQEDFERHVRKGEKGIRILAPTFGKDEGTGDAVLRGFVPVPVFDVSQTEGKPIPEPARPLTLEGHEGGELFDTLLTYAQTERVHVRLARGRLELGDANGDYNPRSREVRLKANPMRQMAKTVAHELSHHVHLTYLGAESTDRGERETVAEGSAFVVAHHFGLETGAYSFPYIAGWARNRERLVQQLDVIHRVSVRIIDALDATAGGELQPRAWSPEPPRQPAPSPQNTV